MKFQAVPICHARQEITDRSHFSFLVVFVKIVHQSPVIRQKVGSRVHQGIEEMLEYVLRPATLG
jgi:hypothetical protein